MTIIRNEMHDRSYSAIPGNGSVYQSLLYTVFQRPRDSNENGMVVALSSATPAAGVSYITRTLVHELAMWKSNSVAQVSTRSLRNLSEPSLEKFQQSLAQLTGNICEPRSLDTLPIPADRAGRWEGSRQYRCDCIGLLRKEFDYTLIDCPSLKDSGDLLSVAAFVDGIILVSEANRTRGDQLHHAERAIEAAQGKMLGHILNKRIYEIPSWIYQML
jgi:hypothetical protein